MACKFFGGLSNVSRLATARNGCGLQIYTNDGALVGALSASLAKLVLSFIACFILLVIAP